MKTLKERYLDYKKALSVLLNEKDHGFSFGLCEILGDLSIYPELMCQEPPDYFKDRLHWWEMGKKEPRVQALRTALEICHKFFEQEQFKIRVNPEQSAIIQKAMFRKGIKWKTGITSPKSVEQPFLAVSHSITHISKEHQDYYRELRLPELSFKEFEACFPSFIKDTSKIGVMKKYYYKTNRGDVCVESCQVKENTGIGSESCTSCSFCQGFDREEKWIKCSKLDEALKTDEYYDFGSSMTISREPRNSVIFIGDGLSIFGDERKVLLIKKHKVTPELDMDYSENYAALKLRLKK